MQVSYSPMPEERKWMRNMKLFFTNHRYTRRYMEQQKNGKNLIEVKKNFDIKLLYNTNTHQEQVRKSKWHQRDD